MEEEGEGGPRLDVGTKVWGAGAVMVGLCGRGSDVCRDRDDRRGIIATDEGTEDGGVGSGCGTLGWISFDNRLVDDATLRPAFCSEAMRFAIDWGGLGLLQVSTRHRFGSTTHAALSMSLSLASTAV